MFSKTSFLLLTIGVVALLGAVNGATFCLSYHPAVGGGGSCSSDAVNCRGGYYCNNQSICVENLRPGTPCISTQDSCAFASRCKGRTGFQTCVANAGPGASCSNDDRASLPRCGSGLICDPSSETCVSGGGTNDTCAKNIDCVSLLCVNSKCFGFPRGASCQSTAQCAPGLFCQGYTGPVNGTCIPLLTAGTCPGYDADCAFGYVCARPNSGDVRQCLKEGSRKAGDYCDDARICDSKRCVNGFCAKYPGEFCWDGDDCSIDQMCGCDGSSTYDGIATCTGGSCLGNYKDLLKCFQENCNGDMENMLTYSTSCVNTLCSGQAKGYIDCNSSGAILSISFFIVAFMAFLASSFHF